MSQLQSRFADRQPKPVMTYTYAPTNPQPVKMREPWFWPMMWQITKIILKTIFYPLYMLWIIAAWGTDLTMDAIDREGGWPVAMKWLIGFMALGWLFTVMPAWPALAVFGTILFVRLRLDESHEDMG